jgi:hypothetical protein
MRALLAVIATLAAVSRIFAADSDAPFPSEDILGCVREAKTVYVFPVKTPMSPRRDDKHLRLLGSDAREDLVRLFGHKRNWYYGLLTIAERADQPTNIGLLFRCKHTDLTLFFDEGGVITVQFRGKRDVTMLEHGLGEQMDEWKQRYAAKELAVK